jgi:hypothetical protein
MDTEIPYEEWLASVDRRVTRWSTWRLEVYRLATYLGELAELDLRRICDRQPAFFGDDFLLQSSKIGAKIAFGHGPGFRAIQLEGFEEALASARAARRWYDCCAMWLGTECAWRRLVLVDTITNNLLLLTQVPEGFDPDAYDDEHWDDPVAWNEEWEDEDDSPAAPGDDIPF